MSEPERIQTASSFVLQSPPGEINDVLNDVRNIVSDDEALQEGILPALREYNLAQYVVVDVPEADYQTIVSEAAIQSSGEEGEEGEDRGVERFLDPRSQKSFTFDHLGLEASDFHPEEPNSESEPLRAALDASALSYLKAHYHDGVAAVFSVPEPKKFIVQMVANKYNPSNYWSGRWRSRYDIDFESKTIMGKVLINVHYYEQGNVQLETTHNLSLLIPPTAAGQDPKPAASKIFALIESEETKLQNSLNDSYQEMGEKAFKGLRRALPLTRQKIDWDRVLGYKLGAELTANKGTFGNTS
ncbi:hypothetical protein HYDPIDRAFT_111793 [Hydnomerulius pinastri MD-312]|uniref:F-actin-capping protein subunit alpha n=1 Tax=Hydnomerulius pinastri MD-312 TaxID=994086 RepID=A0A0C9W9L1_9AGAM|nr:hypothetical protein HYDPIDRAFT_111793 [Hydnomerulius pinastri MD-312]